MKEFLINIFTETGINSLSDLKRMNVRTPRTKESTISELTLAAILLISWPLVLWGWFHGAAQIPVYLPWMKEAFDILSKTDFLWMAGLMTFGAVLFMSIAYLPILAAGEDIFTIKSARQVLLASRRCRLIGITCGLGVLMAALFLLSWRWALTVSIVILLTSLYFYIVFDLKIFVDGKFNNKQ